MIHNDPDPCAFSFHVGSGCKDASVYAETIYLASRVFEIASHLGFKMTLLDIGGGFPGDNEATLSFEKVCLKENNW